ncbi:hypothetical protein Tco_1058746 [Tanacetum coccineum]|uniref:Uncharacterized protein n=1 Tax=Tanacetum coccineum TaxID=301880 RepID=A0ABQ5HAC1_9ASTR
MQKIVDSWKDSSKNLWKLVDSGMSSTSKVGFGYEIKSNDEVLSYEEEMNHIVFNYTVEDFIDKPLYSRFSKTDSFKGDHPLKNMEDRGIFNSGCSGHMTGNKDHLDDFEKCKGGSITFGVAMAFIMIRLWALLLCLTASQAIHDSKVRPRKSSTNSKAEEFLTELQNLKTQEKEAYSTGILEILLKF